jgi:hypothetical protein
VAPILTCLTCSMATLSGCGSAIRPGTDLRAGASRPGATLMSRRITEVHFLSAWGQARGAMERVARQRDEIALRRRLRADSGSERYGEDGEMLVKFPA